MIWHIAKREILENLTRFRFALTLTLVMTLMVMNAVIFVNSKYSRRIAEYSQDTNKAIDSLKERSSNLGELAVKGPGNLYKPPSTLTLSLQVKMRTYQSESREPLLEVTAQVSQLPILNLTTLGQGTGDFSTHRIYPAKTIHYQISRN